MSGRYRTVALQAVGVAVLAAVVFIAFLRPSEPGDLSGIDAPGGDDGPTFVNQPADDNDDQKGKKNNDGKKGKKRPDGGNGNRSTGSRVNANDRRGGEPDGDGIGIPPDGGSSPPGDQYTDLVSVLMLQVGEPTLWREINDP